MLLDLQTIQSTDTQKLGFFRFKKFSAIQYLITNDAGKFHFLKDIEFQDFLLGKVENLPDYQDLKKKGFIKTDDYQARMTGSVALKNHFVGTGPTLHMIVTTLRCNHHCKYCHAAVAPMSAKGMDMTRETATKVVDTIMYTNSPSLTIEFQGGESLVNYEIVQYIVEYASTRAQHLKKNVNFSLVTNLTLMTDEKLDWLMSNGVDICTSLDGDQFNHNNNRTGYNGNSFEKVTYWIKRINQKLVDKGFNHIGALLTVTKENLEHYRNIIDTYIELGLDGIFLRWLNPYGFAATLKDEISYESDEWLEFYKKSLDYIIELNKSGKIFRENITSIYLMKIFNQADPAFMDIRSPSGIAVGGVAYNYDGKIYASDESRMLGRMGIDDFLMTDMLGSGQEMYIAMINSDIANISVQSSCLDGLPGYNDHVYKTYLGVDIIHNFKTIGNLYNPLAKDEKIKLQIGILDYIFTKLQDPEVEKIFMRWIKINK